MYYVAQRKENGGYGEGREERDSKGVKEGKTKKEENERGRQLMRHVQRQGEHVQRTTI